MKKPESSGQGDNAGGGEQQTGGAPPGDDGEHGVVPADDPADASKTPKGKKDEV